MSTQSNTSADDSATKRPKARKRLREIRTRELSLVDRPANASPFLFFKAEGDAPPVNEPGAAPAAPSGTISAVSTAVKQMVLEASANAIEKIQGIALAVGDAPIDDAATSAPVIASAFADIAKAVADLATKIAPAAPADPAPPEEAMKSEGESDATDAADAAKPVSKGDTEHLKVLLAEATEALTATITALLEPFAKSVGELQVNHAEGIAKSEGLREAVNRASVQMGTLLQRDLFKNALPSGNGRPSDGERSPPPDRHWPADLAESARKRGEAG